MFAKIKFYKRLLFEIIETLATICLYLDFEGRRNHNKYFQHMGAHFYELNKFSRELNEVNNEHN